MSGVQALRVEEVRKAGDTYRAKLKDAIERKQEHADMKRDARLNNLQDRIRKHVRYRTVSPIIQLLSCCYVLLSVQFMYCTWYWTVCVFSLCPFVRNARGCVSECVSVCTV